MTTVSAQGDTSTVTEETAEPTPDTNKLRTAITELIGGDLASVNTMLNKQLGSPHPYMADVLCHAGQFRGKQIRPVLLLLSSKALGKDTCETSHTMATVVEMIHTATLVHDDVIDDASTRRHVGTVNSVWSSETSVLLGDYLFSRAFRLAASTGDAFACELIGHATDLTCAGELHQTAARISRSRSERDYFRIIRGKTGRLFGLSCRLGARAAAASDRIQTQLEAAGIELGMAFQIADDLLDLTGNQSTTGKDSGNDLANQRLTLPLLRALTLAAPTERSNLLSLLDSPADAAHSSDRLQTILSLSTVQQGIKSAQETAEELVARCIRRFSLLPPSDARELLQSIAGFAVKRNN